MSRFSVVGDQVEIQMSTAEVAILSRLPALLGSVGADPDDLAPARLHPMAYRDDDDAARELIRLTRDDLAESRAADLEVFARQLPMTADGVAVSYDDAAAWMRVLGAARLVLGARRGLFELDDLSESPQDDPDVALIHLLGVYQGSLSEVLIMSMRNS